MNAAVAQGWLLYRVKIVRFLLVVCELALAPSTLASDESVYYPTVATLWTSIKGSFLATDGTNSTKSTEGSSQPLDNYFSPESREDAAEFIASDGEIRGPFLERSILGIREVYPHLSDQEIARLILSTV